MYIRMYLWIVTSACEIHNSFSVDNYQCSRHLSWLQLLFPYMGTIRLWIRMLVMYMIVQDRSVSVTLRSYSHHMTYSHFILSYARTRTLNLCQWSFIFILITKNSYTYDESILTLYLTSCDHYSRIRILFTIHVYDSKYAYDCSQSIQRMSPASLVFFNFSCVHLIHPYLVL